MNLIEIEEFISNPDKGCEEKVLHMLRHLFRQQSEIKQELNKMSVEQDQINAVVTAIQGVTDGLATADAEIKAEIQALKDANAAGQPLDFSGLDAKVQGLQSIAGDIEGIAPVQAPVPGNTTPSSAPSGTGTAVDTGTPGTAEG